MAATLSLDTITSSGSGITIDAAKTFTVNGNLLTTGATQITSTALAVVSVDNTGTPTVNISGKSASVISVNASSNSSVVTLPPIANFTTCSISVASPVTHGAGYKIEIKDNGGTELFTLFNKGDHCEFVSDGTSVLRTGNEHVTIQGHVSMTANVTLATNGMTDVFDLASSANYDVTQFGDGWNSTTDDFIAPFDGIYAFGGYVLTAGSVHGGGWNFHDGTVFITENSSDYLPGPAMQGPIAVNMSKNDKIVYYGSCHSTGGNVLGAASGGRRCRADFWMIRRF